jgi:hypothetical protein
MINKRTSAAAILLTSVLASASAHAQETPVAFGDGHQLVLATERIFGYVYSSQTTTVNGMEQTVEVNSFSLFSTTLNTVFSAPRLALDYFVTQRFSLGLAASYFRLSQDIPDQTNVFAPTYTGFLFAPRAGYAVPLSPIVSLWPRLGLTIMNLELEAEFGGASSSSGATYYAVTIEAPLVLTIAPHVFIGLGPTLDQSVSGSSDNTSQGTSMSEDVSATNFGFQASLGGYL